MQLHHQTSASRPRKQSRGIDIRNGRGLDEVTHGTRRDQMLVRMQEIYDQNFDGRTVTFKRRDEAVGGLNRPYNPGLGV